MIRPVLLVLCSVLLVGMSCPGAGPTLSCANQLDGSAFGFTLTVPDGFTCVPTSPLQALLVLARVTFSQESTGIGFSIAVSQPQGDNSGGTLAGDREYLFQILLMLNKKVHAAKGAMVLCSIREDLKKVFTITSLDKIFKFLSRLVIDGLCAFDD